MNSGSSLLFRVLLILAVFLALKYFVPFGKTVLYPINLLVTFLHEFGHAIGAIITGGGVNYIRVNPDGSGLTESVGGWRSIILMGGYIGSAVFGNILLYLGTRSRQTARITLIVLAALMIFSGIWWFNSLYSTIFLILFSGALIVIANYSNFQSEVLFFLGLASVVRIVEDFNVGPSSDLEQYAKTIPIMPASWWMYVWLVIVLIICFYNIRMILRTQRY